MREHSRRPPRVEAPSRIRTTLLGYLALTKPRVIELLLVTTIPAMLLADRGTVDPLLILNTLVGGLLAAAGANTLNCVADADIDKMMKRTERRPLARDSVPRSHALVFGLALSVASFFWLWWTTNMLSAHLAGATIAFYVLVYTLLLKRRTSQNVVWGGAAGCMPVMIGWSAVTGTIQWPALVMFAIIFFWTPPHTWALAMRYKEDYQAAGVPMLPAVATERQVTKQILIYTWLTVLTTLALALATGWLYASVALVAGTWFLAMAHQLYAGVRRGEPVKPLRLFLQSNNYLAVVFCALAIDSALDLPTLLSRLSSHHDRRIRRCLQRDHRQLSRAGEIQHVGARTIWRNGDPPRTGGHFQGLGSHRRQCQWKCRSRSPIDHQCSHIQPRAEPGLTAKLRESGTSMWVAMVDRQARRRPRRRRHKACHSSGSSSELTMQVIDEDHYTHQVVYGAGDSPSTRDQIAYAVCPLPFRKLIDPNDRRRRVHAAIVIAGRQIGTRYVLRRCAC